jgi:hypothetical protein
VAHPHCRCRAVCTQARCEVVGAAMPGLVDFGQRPEDQPGLWEGVFGS